jgi:hypothetical protein
MIFKRDCDRDKKYLSGVAGSVEILKSKFDLKFSGKVRLKNIKQGPVEIF